MTNYLTGKADMVAFGRYYTSNPDLVFRFQNSLPLIPYDRSTFYTNDMDGYLDWENAKIS